MELHVYIINITICSWCSKTEGLVVDYRGGSTSVKGRVAPNFRLVPKCDIKHCLMNLIHRHIGAKTNCLWPSKYAKMHFRLRISRWSPGPLVGWGGDTSSRLSASIFAPSALAIRRFNVGHSPQYLCLEPASHCQLAVANAIPHPRITPHNLSYRSKCMALR